jgi:hypothetical protein
VLTDKPKPQKHVDTVEVVAREPWTYPLSEEEKRMFKFIVVGTDG